MFSHDDDDQEPAHMREFGKAHPELRQMGRSSQPVVVRRGVDSGRVPAPTRRGSELLNIVSRLLDGDLPSLTPLYMANEQKQGLRSPERGPGGMLPSLQSGPVRFSGSEPAAEIKVASRSLPLLARDVEWIFKWSLVGIEMHSRCCVGLHPQGIIGFREAKPTGLLRMTSGTSGFEQGGLWAGDAASYPAAPLNCPAEACIGFAESTMGPMFQVLFRDD